MLELDYPSDEFIVAFANRHRFAPVDVLRDIARLVAIHQMTVESKFLNDNCVLCGGVAMRFYGSHRFTITDTDASYRLDDWDELNLEAALEIEVEDLEIEAGDPAYWGRRTQLTTAQPVHFTEQFSNFRTDPQQRKFKVTVSRRGLIKDAVWTPIVHDYPPMGIEDLKVPVMDMNEQLAEKMLGWAVNGLAKHYLDCAWIVTNQAPLLNRNAVTDCLLRKLSNANAREPDNYAHLETIDDFFRPLYLGDRWDAPLNTSTDRAVSLIRYVGTPLTMPQATTLVRERLLPLLWDQGRAVRS
jgi:hypothetical protein